MDTTACLGMQHRLPLWCEHSDGKTTVIYPELGQNWQGRERYQTNTSRQGLFQEGCFFRKLRCTFNRSVMAVSTTLKQAAGKHVSAMKMEGKLQHATKPGLITSPQSQIVTLLICGTAVLWSQQMSTYCTQSYKKVALKQCSAITQQKQK